MFFVRSEQLSDLCQPLTEVDSTGSPRSPSSSRGRRLPCAADAAVVADPAGCLADAYGAQAFLAIHEMDWWCTSATTGVLASQSPLAEQVRGVLAELEPVPGESG